MELSVERLQQQEERAWDEFILRFPASTFFHRIGWKNVIEASYGLQPYYLIAKRGDEITGALPLFRVDRRLVSVPFAPYGGPVAENDIARSLLVRSAASILRNENLQYAELRNLERIDDGVLGSESIYSTFFIGLDSGREFLWQHTSKSARRLVNKARESGMTTEMDPSFLGAFYNLYTIANRDFGTPVHSCDFFRQILETFPREATIQAALLNGRIIGAKFLLFHGKTITSGWAVTDRNYRKSSPNSLLTWDILQYGCDHGYHVFDFGRSESQTGSYNFKARWGDPRVRQIYTQCCFGGAGAAGNVSKFSKKRQLFSRVYRMLPLPLTVKIGPHIRKHFP